MKLKKLNKIIKLLTIWFIIGMCYFVLEGLWRIPKGGYANIIMLFIGGLCGLFIGSINQIPKFYNLAVWQQSFIGTIIVICVEYISGYILNIKLGLHIWDYSNLYFNINGQICLLYTGLWFLLMPTAIWLEDWLRYKLWNEGKYYSVIDIYKKLIIGK